MIFLCIITSQKKNNLLIKCCSLLEKHKMNYRATAFYVQNQLRNLLQIRPRPMEQVGTCDRDTSCSDSKYQEFTVLSLDNEKFQQKCIYSGDYKYKYSFAIVDSSESASDSCMSPISVTISTTSDCIPVGNNTALLLCSGKCYVWKPPSAGDNEDANWLALNYSASEKKLFVAVTCNPSEDACLLETENGLKCDKVYK